MTSIGANLPPPAPLTGRLVETMCGNYQQHHHIGAPFRARPTWPALLYVVEGEIGAGKTVICQEIANELRAAGKKVCLILEPVDCWRDIGILKKFYDDRARHAYGFQTFVYATRVLAIERAIEAEPKADIYLLERSPATDQIFMELQRDLLDEVEMKMYETWCASWQQFLRVDISKARVLYLKPSLEQCMSRTKARAREGELKLSEGSAAAAEPAAAEPKKESSGGVTIEYQALLRRAHERFLQGKHPDEFPLMPKSPFPLESVIEIGPALADANFRDPSPERDRVVGEILRMMGFERERGDVQKPT